MYSLRVLSTLIPRLCWCVRIRLPALQMNSIDWSGINFTKTSVRPLQRQRLWSAMVCTQLAVPLLLAACMFVYMYFSGLAMVTDISIDTDVSFQQERRKVRLCRLLVTVFVSL